MAIEFINSGSIVNDGTGDTLRVTADKINKNFAEMDATISGSISVTDHDVLANIGVTGHADLDIHVGDATKHFTQAEISITESQISDLTHTDLTTIQSEVDLNTAKETNVDHPLVEKAVPSDALFTDTIYTHPTDDGDKHVPANGTTNDGKVLTAGAIAGTYTWEVNDSGVVDHTALSNIGTNTHVEIDAHIANVTTNPHSVDKDDVGLSNVDNTSDANKPISSDTQTALDGKVDDAQVLTDVPLGALFTDTDTVYDDTSIQAEVDLNTAKVTDLVHPLVETAVPVGALFTDTDTVYDDTAIQAEVTLNTTDRHTHANKIVIDKFGENGEGLPTYNGNQVDTTIAQRDVYDGLDSVDNTISLSAKQGKVLKDEQDIQNDKIVLNTAKVSNVDHPLVQTAVPLGAVFTDTPYDDSDVLKDADVLSPVTGINKLMTQDDVAGLGGGDMLKSTYDINDNGIVDNSEKVNNLTVETAVPVGALFTDTVYDDTSIQAEVDLNTAKVGITTQQASDITTNNAKVSNVDHPLVETAVPVGAVFTDTIYDDSDVAKKTEINTFTVDQNFSGSVNMADTSILGVDQINFFNTGDAPISNIYWDNSDMTLYLDNGRGHATHIGRDLESLIYNNTGADFIKGDVISIYGSAELNGKGYPVAFKPRADRIESLGFNLMFCAEDIASGTIGIGTRTGTVYDYDTSAWAQGTILYLSDTVAGKLTNVKPSFPSYPLLMGGVTESGLLGRLIIQPTLNPENSVHNFWNGTMRESFDLPLTSNGTVITATLTNQDAGQNHLTMKFSDGDTIIENGTTIVIPAGTDTVPLLSYIYIPISTKVLTTSTSGWPADEHIKLSTVVTRSALTVQSKGALKSHLWNDHVQGTNGQGHLSHITNKLRQGNAQWSSGTEGSVNTDGTNMYATVTSGKVYQIHEQTFASFNTQTGDDVHIINDSIAPFIERTNLNAITLDSTGGSLANSSYSLVLWGVVNSSTATDQLMINLPSGTYAKTTPEDAEADLNSYASYTIPNDYKGTGFLIAKFNIQYTGGVYSIYSTQDLRGVEPNVASSGGGSGGSGASTFLGLTDTPGTFIGSQFYVPKVNSTSSALEFVVSDKTLVGLDNVDNTSDLDKPISTATQTALDGKVDDAQVLTNVPAGAIFTDTLYDDTTIQAEVDLNTAKVTNVDHPLVETAVPLGAVFTDTVYDDTVIQSEVDLNTAKVGVTAQLVSDVDTNTLKVGITTQQAADIVTNNAKVSNVDHPLVETSVPVGAVFTDTVYDDTTIQAEVDLNTAKVGITPTQASDITTNNAKISASGTELEPTDIGVTVQGYDVNTAKTDVDNLFTVKQTITSAVVGDDVLTVAGSTGDLLTVTDIDTGTLLRVNNNIGTAMMTLSDIGSLTAVKFIGDGSSLTNLPGGGDMNKATYDTNDNGIVDNAETVNSLTVETAVPAGALFTDTVYDDTTIQSEVDLNTAKVSLGTATVGSNELKAELSANVFIPALNVDWATGIQFVKVLTANSTLTFSNYTIGKTITLLITGNYTLTLPSGVDVTELADYDQTKTNWIQIYCGDASGTPVFLSSVRTR